MNTPLPTVSVVIPCRNEKAFISACLDSLIYNGYPAEKLQILVVDGLSSDGTRELILEYASRHSNVHLLDNLKKTTPVALNIGVQHSNGDLILIMSAHATYDEQAIEKLACYSATYEAQNVGGICKIVPRDNGSLGRAIVLALSHRFGIGGATYRLQNGLTNPIWVDTAAFGCYRREVFRDIGPYNENLVHSQDMELNLRLRSAGGRTLLVPDVAVRYFARSDLRSFIKHNFRNGQWVILPFAFCSAMPVAWRHLVPFAFIASVIGTAIAGLIAPSFWPLTFGILLLYVIANLGASVEIAWRKRDARYLLLMPPVFGILHIVHGLGAIAGVIRLLSMRCFWMRLLSSGAPHSHGEFRADSHEG